MKSRLITKTNASEFEEAMNILLGKIDGNLVDIKFCESGNGEAQRYSALVVYK
ncbi:sporulation protein Cse60 [Sporolactobacillus pectinivorans]|uniref:sporulation protein Cse60 n=1 Tax=Sporolactobacillus pectinivorans TaxID=1591408 RepID=UPI0012FDD9CC|nr:sporulation protein Cse60 [Sporolactobacillus pectinivorans]